MLRLEGDVFLFGTAIQAPLKSIKMRRSAPLLSAGSGGSSRGGSRIVANRGSYSATQVERKSGRERGVADERVGAPLVAEGRYRTMSRDEGGVVAHRPQLLGDRADQLLLVAARKIPPPDRALEQDVADRREVRGRMVEHDMAGGVARAMAHIEGQIADGHLVAV